MRRIIGVAALAAVVSTLPVKAQNNPLLQAMQEELTRSMSGLKLKDQPPPYYIAYTLEDAATASVNATLGAIVSQNARRARMLRVEVRVGDYTRDSSRFVSFDRDAGIASMLATGIVFCALDDDMNVIRRQLWLTTDAAYKRAVSTYSKKLASLQNQVTTDPIPDFSKETPQERILAVPAPAVSIGAWPATLREVSAALRSPDIIASNATLTVVQGARYFINSEGFKTVAPLQLASLRVVAETQAEDGMPLRDGLAVHARTLDGLPPPADLVNRARALGEGLRELRKAPIGEEYTGPLLVEGQAASELLAQTFVPLFLSVRLPDMENRQMMGARGPSSPFLTRVGLKILPDGFAVGDTPSLARFDNQDVPGAYVLDDEGVPAQDVTLAENGTLKALLTSRTPQRGFLNSNGHARGGSAQAGVFQLRSTTGVPAAKLRATYLARLEQEGRPFGYIVRAIAHPSVNRSFDGDEMSMSMMTTMGGPMGARGGPSIVRAVKVTPNGKEELVRGLRLATVAHTSYRDIVDASEERALYTYRASMPPEARMPFAALPGPLGSDVTVSIIAPNLLFAELELEKPDAVHQRPPLVPSPLSSR
jgi:predicted Zn-dependent protease